MRNIFRVVFLFLCLFTSQNVLAQIGGISASKVNSFNVAPIPLHSIEFEPTFSSSKSSSYWDQNGIKFSSDTASVSSGLAWRVTYGLSEKTEIGLSTTPLINGLSLGFKTQILEQNNFQLATMGGFNFPFGNRTYDTKNPSVNDITSIAIGAIGSLAISEKSSLDVNLTYQDYFKQVDFAGPSLIFSADVDLYNKKETLLFLFSTYFQKNYLGDNSSSFFSISPGVSIETGENFLFVFNTSHALFGSNTSISHGLSLAVTMSIN